MTTAMVVQDFFSDKDAAAKASNLPVPKKLTPEEQARYHACI